MKNLKFRKPKILSVLTLIYFLFVALSCQYKDDSSEVSNQDQSNNSFFEKVSCDAGDILEFPDLTSIQAEHAQLYNQYNSNSQDIVVLENYEVANGNFYSLRLKDYEMNEGLIPNDPSFDPFDYTTDEILETMLNRDGMIVIDHELYLWSDGSVIFKMPFTCDTYPVMLDFASMFNGGYTNGLDQNIEQMMIDFNIQPVIIGNDPRFDFESLSEAGISIDNKKNGPIIDAKSLCGLDTFLTVQMANWDPNSMQMEIKITANNSSTAGTNPLNIISIKNKNDYADLQAPGHPIFNSIGYAINNQITLHVDCSNYGNVNDIPDIEINLESYINLFTINSCHDSDLVNFSFKCPLNLTKEKLNFGNAQYKFIVDGVQFVNPNNDPYVIFWNFGDGTTLVTNNSNEVIHSFPIPCGEETYYVTANLGENQGWCANILTTPVNVKRACALERFGEKSKFDYDGKKGRIVTKLRPRLSFFGLGSGGSKFKNKFRYRKSGDKSISSNGLVLSQVGINCNQVQISSVLQPGTQYSVKKRYVQKQPTTNPHYYDLSNPYTVSFSHSNGFSQTLTHIVACME